MFASPYRGCRAGAGPALRAAEHNRLSDGLTNGMYAAVRSAITDISPKDQLFKNLGIAWQRMEGRDPNASTNAKQAWQRFLELDDGSDKDAATIRQWILGR